MDWLLTAATSSDPTLVAQALALSWTAIKWAGGLGFVIFVHELGHFLVAKACGVKCEKFYIGFDIFNLRFCRFQWGETEYGIGALPLGGYVKMLGQDDDPRNFEQEAERSKALAEGTAAEGQTSGATVEKPQAVKMDPRSYLAKPIPARMAIISAGVIMNVIFAALMAAVAFKMGVQNPPAVIGGTSPGSPAWLAGWRPGDKVLQFGKQGKPSEHLRYMDLIKQVTFNAGKSNLDVLIRHTDGTEEWYAIRPAPRDPKKPGSGVMIGVLPMFTRKLEVPPPKIPIVVTQSEPPYESDDVVVAVNGKPVEQDYELPGALAANPSGPLKFSLLRYPKDKDGKPTTENPERLEVVVPEVPMRDIGLVMKMGPITAIRPGSPAAEAGIEKGDVIEQVDGEPVGNPLSLPQRLLPKSGQEVTLTLTRGGSQREAKVKLGQPGEGSSVGGALDLDGVGLAYTVSNVIADVVPDSPADKAGLKAGQTVGEYQFVPNEADTLLETERLGRKPTDPRKVNAEGPQSWALAFAELQYRLPATRIRLTVDDQGKWTSKEVETVASTTFFDASRKLRLATLRTTQQAKSWPQALEWGIARTKDDLGEVLTVLNKLRTRDVSATNLSGPLGILGVTWQFASQGLPDLLIFLTYISANLAVINMLPIPVLDGGHLVFLAYEWIRGKPADAEWQFRLSLAGLLFLLSVMVFATAMDFGRLFGG